MSTATAVYSRTHRALLDTAEFFETVPFVVRLAVAIAERDGAATTDELEDDLHETQSSAIRRSALRMYDQGLAIGLASDGGPRRRGMRSRLSLTVRGQELVDHFCGYLVDGGGDAYRGDFDLAGVDDTRGVKS